MKYVSAKEVARLLLTCTVNCQAISIVVVSNATPKKLKSLHLQFLPYSCHLAVTDYDVSKQHTGVSVSHVDEWM